VNFSKDAAIEDWDQLDDLLGAMREKVAEKEKRVSKRDAEVAAVAARHSGRIDELSAEVSAMETRALAFLETKKEIFGEPAKTGEGRKAGPRFKDLLHGRVGTRQVPAKVLPIRGLSFDEIVEYIRASTRTSLKRFVRTTHEINKQKVIAEMDEETLSDVGLEIRRDDKLYIDLKKA